MLLIRDLTLKLLLCLLLVLQLTLTVVSTPAVASRRTRPSPWCWKSRLYTGSLLCQAISHVTTFILVRLDVHFIRKQEKRMAGIKFTVGFTGLVDWTAQSPTLD